MTAGSPQRDGAGWFTAPGRVNQRRYEALRAFFVDGLTYEQAGERFGYTRWAMVNLVREHRAGQAAKSITWARGRLVSRPGVAGLMLASGSGRRTSRPNPSPARISPTDVRFSGRPSAASRAEIS